MKSVYWLDSEHTQTNIGIDPVHSWIEEIDSYWFKTRKYIDS